MTVIDEGNLRFCFPDEWEAVKYDDAGGFVARNCRIDGTKRVDILARSPSSRLVLIEIKDFRNHAIENKDRLNLENNDALHVEVAKKVLNTFAFLYAAFRSNDSSLTPYYRSAFESRRKFIEIVLFLEQDRNRIQTIRGQRSTQNILDGMKHLLKPFQVKCFVSRRYHLPANHPWTVESRPYAGTNTG